MRKQVIHLMEYTTFREDIKDGELYRDGHYCGKEETFLRDQATLTPQEKLRAEANLLDAKEGKIPFCKKCLTNYRKKHGHDFKSPDRAAQTCTKEKG